MDVVSAFGSGQPRTNQNTCGFVRNFSAFSDRLGSFKHISLILTQQISTWFGKPIWFSPIQCSLHGWRNIAIDSLRCDTCRKLWCVPSRLNTVSAEKEYSKLLFVKHDKSCPWQTAMCPVSFAHLPNTRDAALVEWKERVQSFELIDLSSVNMDFLSEISDGSDQLSDSLPSDQAANSVPRAILTLAACGWSVQSSPLSADRPLLSCERCRSRCLPSADFHAIEKHKFWCPWVQTALSSSSGGETLSGWQQQFRLLCAAPTDSGTGGAHKRSAVSATSEDDEMDGVQLKKSRLVSALFADVIVPDAKRRKSFERAQRLIDAERSQFSTP